MSRSARASLARLALYWSRNDVISTLRESMTRAFRQVIEMSDRECVTLRDAAYLIAVQRVAEASRLRGWV